MSTQAESRWSLHDDAGRPSTTRSALQQTPWLSRHRRRLDGGVSARYLLAKRCLDVTLVLLLSPVWLAVYALVLLSVKMQSPGAPAHFSQQRTGRDGRRFRVYKFRTMVRDAEQMKESLRHLNLRTWPDFKIENDPRVTRIGAFLRKASLDELPQLWNVLRGDMSLVGPRPTTLPVTGYEAWQLARFQVPGGLTGPWQICGRANPSFVERVRLDIAYADRCSLLLDIEILLRTLPAVVLQRSGAC